MNEYSQLAIVHSVELASPSMQLISNIDNIYYIYLGRYYKLIMFITLWNSISNN